MKFLDYDGLVAWTAKLKTYVSTAISNVAVATSSAKGYMSAADKAKLDGIAANANNYSLPAASGSARGGVKIGSNITLSSDVISLTKANVTAALGYTPPTTNTTYNAVTTSTNGLMIAADKAKLDKLSFDSSNKINASCLPSYVDDVLDGYLSNGKFYKTKNSDGTYATEISAESGKIYIDLNTSKTYRWSGTAYAVISETLALGTTSSTAFRGDYGNTAYTHATAKGSAFASGFYKITTNAQGHVTAATAVTKADITNLGIPGSDTHWTSHLYLGTGTAANAASTNGNTKLVITDNSTIRNTITIKGTGGATVTSDANGVITINSATYSLPLMTASARGGAKLGSDTVQSVAANAVSATASRTYAVQKNSSEQLVVNVPWTDHTYSSLKNPTAITIVSKDAAGQTVDNVVYDGSAAKSLTMTAITTAEIEALFA